MGRLREIPRTAAFAWSPSIATPSIATGTRAGAVDADFSNETKLELWDVDLSSKEQSTELQPVGSIGTDSRFYDIAWSQPNDNQKGGIIAGALENGALDLWDAAKLRESSDALISRTNSHSGAIKALQFNPHRPELLATSGAKGELYITDLNNASNPFRLGASAARADDFDALDWNKKVPHIMATGSSGGFLTVWDVKAKKESLTLNNYNRKPVSAVAWNPDVPTKLATAVPSDQDPLILMWDLRNSSAPERILKGHDQGVLSLSWCLQDSDLLLSCGKDNRNICWNPHTAVAVGEFPIVTNWTFQTRFNMQHPNLLATASFDGKIAVQSIQNTNTQADASAAAASQAADGEDFFAKAQSQPQGASFSLSKPPKWLARPCGVSFAYGGKVVTFGTSEQQPNKSHVRISKFASDPSVEQSISELQKSLHEENLEELCDSMINQERTEEAKNDWKVMKTLVSDSPRTGLLEYLGFEKTPESTSKEVNGEAAEDSVKTEEDVPGDKSAKSNRLSSFFDNTGEGQNFLSDLAASKGARTNNPFKIYTGTESDEDKRITKALMLGSFEEALDICLEAKRMSDAFMIAICGGQKCIDKAQAAYFSQQADGPNYLRLLASVVGRNLWDTVYNADLENWAEVMATLCTFADETEFPDLCEALGDRLEEQDNSRKNASFCFLAGSKLEKVVPIWINEMRETEKSRAAADSDESAFSIHVQALQHLIEKVSIFRRVTKYEDKDAREKSSGWKLEPLYAKYAEYADVAASYGHMQLAEHYLDLLPDQYPAADVARNRVQKATKKTSTATPATQRQLPTQPAVLPAQAPYGIPSYPGAAPSPYAPAGYQPTAQPRGPTPGYGAGAYQPPVPNLTPGPPVAAAGAVPPPAPPKNLNGQNWNDLPDSFQKTPSRRGTPNPAPMTSPFASQTGQIQPNPYGTAPLQNQPRTASPLPPPPKAGAPPPPRVGSPLVGQPPDQSQFSPSAAASSYAPPSQSQPSYTAPGTTLPQRTASPYNPPPTAAAPARSDRYAPAPGSISASAPPPGTAHPVAPNPYTYQQQSNYAPQPSTSAAQAPPPRSGPPPTGPPPRATAPPAGPPPVGNAPGSRPGTGSSQSGAAQGVAKHPPGDRSHIPADALPIFDVLNAEMERVKGKAPAQYKQHVDDAQKRLGILFDMLNNNEIPPVTVGTLNQIAQALQGRDFERAQGLHTELMKQADQSGPWMVGVKRLITMSKATPL